MKIKITIEYEVDDPDNTFENEKHDWRYGNVSIADLIEADIGAVVTFEQIA